MLTNNKKKTNKTNNKKKHAHTTANTFTVKSF